VCVCVCIKPNEMHLRSIYEFCDYGLAQLDSKSIFRWNFQPIFVRYNNDPVRMYVYVYICMYLYICMYIYIYIYMQGVSGGMVNILGGGNMDHSE